MVRSSIGRGTQLGLRRVGWIMDNESKECPLCNVQADADRMGWSWELVNLAKESEHEEHDDPNITPT